MCNCFGDKKEEDEEEDYYGNNEEKYGEEEVERKFDSEDEIEDEYKNCNGEVKLEMGIDNFPLPPDEQPPQDVPDIVITCDDVTESRFEAEAEAKPKKSHLKSILKKMKKPLRGVRFGVTTTAEATPLVTTPVGSYDGNYGTTLEPLKRSDSLESFMSAMSSATTANVQEFGADEVSAGKLQITIDYEPKRWHLVVGAKQGEGLVALNKEAIMYWQVHITLLPFKKHRFKTKYKRSSTPIFNATYEIDNIASQALPQLALRFRVYGRAGLTGKKKLAGEVEVELSDIMTAEDHRIKEWKDLKRSFTSPVRRETRI